MVVPCRWIPYDAPDFGYVHYVASEISIPGVDQVDIGAPPHCIGFQDHGGLLGCNANCKDWYRLVKSRPIQVTLHPSVYGRCYVQHWLHVFLSTQRAYGTEERGLAQDRAAS